MAPASRGERGRRIRKTTGTGGTLKRIMAAGNPLKGGVGRVASAEVSIKGAGFFVGFSVKF